MTLTKITRVTTISFCDYCICRGLCVVLAVLELIAQVLELKAYAITLDSLSLVFKDCWRHFSQF